MLHRQKQTRMSKHIIYNVTQTKTNENVKAMSKHIIDNVTQTKTNENVKAHNIQCYTDKNKRECQST